MAFNIEIGYDLLSFDIFITTSGHINKMKTYGDVMVVLKHDVRVTINVGVMLKAQSIHKDHCW